MAAGLLNHALQRGSEGVAAAGIAPALGEKWEHGLEHFRPERRGGVVVEGDHALGGALRTGARELTRKSGGTNSNVGGWETVASLGGHTPRRIPREKIARLTQRTKRTNSGG